MTDKNENDLSKINYDKLILSEAIPDSKENPIYTVRLLYALNIGTSILIQEIESKEVEVIPYNTKNLTITDLYNLPEEDPSIELLKRLINFGINKSGTLTLTIEEEVTEITDSLITNLYELTNEEDEEAKKESLLQRKKQFIIALKDSKLKEIILDVNELLESKALNNELEDIKHDLKEGKSNKKLLQRLGNYLNKKEGVILRKNIHDMYKLDISTNAYKHITLDELVQFMEGLFNEKNLINDNDLDKAIHYITDRLEPETNIIKFDNCLYSMKEHKIIESEVPVFTLLESPFNYNPEAKSVHVEKFLHESLKVKDHEKTDEEIEELTKQKVKGVYQLIGYLFTSGNYLNILPLIVGTSGSGKSIFGNILTAIFGGSEKISDVKLEKLSNPNDNHALSGLVNKNLNIIKDSDNSVIKDEGMIKQLTGNEDIFINPKGKPPYSLNKDYVPKSLLVANNPPKFINIPESILERLLFLEFTVKFRGTKKQDKHLEEKILGNPEEIEFLIFNSLKAFKEMVEEDEDFILRVSKEKTLELLNKHSKPINYLIKKLISKVDQEAYISDEYEDPKDDISIYTNDLNRYCLKLAKDEGIEVPKNDKGMIYKNRIFKAIKEEFELEGVLFKNNDKSEEFHVKTKLNKRTGKKERYYPYAIKSDVYKKYEKDEQDNNK